MEFLVFTLSHGEYFTNNCPARLVAAVGWQRMMTTVRPVRGEQRGAVLTSVMPGDWT